MRRWHIWLPTRTTTCQQHYHHQACCVTGSSQTFHVSVPPCPCPPLAVRTPRPRHLSEVVESLPTKSITNDTPNPSSFLPKNLASRAASTVPVDTLLDWCTGKSTDKKMSCFRKTFLSVHFLVLRARRAASGHPARLVDRKIDRQKDELLPENIPVNRSSCPKSVDTDP